MKKGTIAIMKAYLSPCVAIMTLLSSCLIAHENPVILSLTTGVFLTDLSNQEGWVSPWKLDMQGRWNRDNTTLSIQAESQTGIIQGPYIDGFNNTKTDFSIRKATLTHKLQEQQSLMLGLGRVKANLQKAAGTKTPLPFSGALSQPPLQSSDAALSYQIKGTLQTTDSFTVGFAESNTANNTQPEKDRLSNVFLEYAASTNTTTLWIQYTKNQINTIYASDDYLSLGSNFFFRSNLLSVSSAFNGDRLAGYDIGITRQFDSPFPTTLGLGFAHINDEKVTVEVSAINKLNNNLAITTSYYWQKPSNSTGYNNGGIKLVYSIG
jgi:hypothetical protein